MIHNHSFWALWFHANCPKCLRRRLVYGFRADKVGLEKEIERIMRNKDLTTLEKQFILRKD